MLRLDLGVGSDSTPGKYFAKMMNSKLLLRNHRYNDILKLKL